MKFELIPTKIEKRYLQFHNNHKYSYWALTKTRPAIKENVMRYTIDKAYHIRVDKEWLEAHANDMHIVRRCYSFRYNLYVRDVIEELAKLLNVDKESICRMEYSQPYLTANTLDEFGDLSDNPDLIFINTKEAIPLSATSKKEQEHVEKIKETSAELTVINSMLKSTIQTVLKDMGMQLNGSDVTNSSITFINGESLKKYVMSCLQRDLTQRLNEVGIEILKFNKPKTVYRIEYTHGWVNGRDLRMKKA